MEDNNYELNKSRCDVFTVKFLIQEIDEEVAKIFNSFSSISDVNNLLKAQGNIVALKRIRGRLEEIYINNNNQSK